jgi:hypothetical protein
VLADASGGGPNAFSTDPLKVEIEKSAAAPAAG